MTKRANELTLRVRKKMQTRQQITDAAKALFAARGYDAVTVADIARLADVPSRRSITSFPARSSLFSTKTLRSTPALWT